MKRMKVKIRSLLINIQMEIIDTHSWDNPENPVNVPSSVNMQLNSEINSYSHTSSGKQKSANLLSLPKASTGTCMEITILYGSFLLEK